MIYSLSRVPDPLSHDRRCMPPANIFLIFANICISARPPHDSVFTQPDGRHAEFVFWNEAEDGSECSTANSRCLST